jgi:16S rRNA (cytidine1402-2'-O)-methyltransferase
VVPIPGPSAAIAALSAAGLPTGQFRFAGFLPPREGQRRRALEPLDAEPGTTVFYEAPHRILDALADIEAVLGPDRPVVVAREVTKLHEEFLRGPVAVVRRTLASRPSVKGEITLLVGPAAPESGPPPDDGQLAAEVREMVEGGTGRMEAIKHVARRHGLPKREVYRLLGGHSLYRYTHIY